MALVEGHKTGAHSRCGAGQQARKRKGLDPRQGVQVPQPRSMPVMA